MVASTIVGLAAKDWCHTQLGTAAAAGAVAFAAQATVCVAASRPALQLLASCIMLVCATVAGLAWRSAGLFTLVAALPVVLAGEMALSGTARV